MNCGQHGQKKIEQDEGIGIPGTPAHHDAHAGVNHQAGEKRENKCPGTAEAGDSVGDAFAERGVVFDDFVGIAHGAQAHQLLRTVKLPAEHGEHVHSSHGLAFQQHRNVAAVHFNTSGFFQGHRAGLVGSFFEHAGEAKKFAVAGFIDDDFLMIFVDGGHADFAGNHDVGAAAGVADFINALARREFFQFNLRSQDGSFVVIEQRKERYVFQFVGIASHRPPRRL